LRDRPTVSKRHIRWLEALQHFKYEVGYHSGKKNTAADPLSRRSDHLGGESEKPQFKPERMKPIEELEINMIGLSMEEVGIALVMTDGDIQEGIRKWIRKTEGRVPKLEKKEGLLMEHRRIWVPPDEEIKR